MASLQGSFIWYELMTADPAGSKAFYEAVTGWQFLVGGPEHPDYGFISNSDGGMTGGVLTLSEAMRQGGAVPGWYGYIGVDDCDVAAARVTALGGRVLMPARDVPMAGRIAMVADPGGVPFYIMTPKPPPGASQQSSAFDPLHIGRCAWNELLAADQQQALDFYTALFGWSLPGAMDMGAMGSYQFIGHGEERIGAVMQKPPQAPTPHWHHYFRVSSIDTAAAAIAAQGGMIMFGPYEVPGGDHMIQCIDPQGATFELVGKR